MKIDDIIKQIQNAEGKASANRPLPPVDQWHPPFSGDLDMRITRSGAWFYLGSEIKRPALVKLFSSILLYEGGEYYLVTPVEKYRIQVDDVPFIIVASEHRYADDPDSKDPVSVWVCTTNVGESVVLDNEHPLNVVMDAETEEPSPYVLVRSNLKARVNRNVFYQMVEQAECEEGETNCLYLMSCHERFELGRF